MTVADIQVGRRWDGPPYLMTVDNIRQFSARFEGELTKHTDAETARTQGLPGPLAQALMPYALAYELLNDSFGVAAGWFSSELEMAFMKPIFEGDEITAHAEVTAVDRGLDGSSVARLAVWCDNRDGSPAASGSAVIQIRVSPQ